MKVKPKGAGAVMAQRREPPDSLDFFPTPPWATRALCEIVLGRNDFHTGLGEVCWDPCAGEGHMAEVLKEYFTQVYASDVFDYGKGYAVGSFVSERVGLVDDVAHCPKRPDWIVMNPPFNHAQPFLSRALAEARRGVAMLVRNSWLETEGRYEQTFRENPPSVIAVFVERCAMFRGRWVPSGSTATCYVWLVWDHLAKGCPTRFMWIPPGQREALTKPEDFRKFAEKVSDEMLGVDQP